MKLKNLLIIPIVWTSLTSSYFTVLYFLTLANFYTTSISEDKWFARLCYSVVGYCVTGALLTFRNELK